MGQLVTERGRELIFAPHLPQQFSGDHDVAARVGKDVEGIRGANQDVRRRELDALGREQPAHDPGEIGVDQCRIGKNIVAREICALRRVCGGRRFRLDLSLPSHGRGAAE